MEHPESRKDPGMTARVTVQPFPGRRDAAGRRLGTFSYLPLPTPAQVLAQVQHCIDQGWTCAVEHVEPERAGSEYWYMWKLPMFGSTDAEAVLAEVRECTAAHPTDLVKLVAIDRRRQTQGLAFVVSRGQAA
jgi:ribulose-bisphosphate carboxylase small chain